MNYEERYKKALERAKRLYEQGTITESLGFVFSELAESEDEKMLREIKRYIKEQGDKPTGLPNGTVPVSDMIAWLEKQGKSDNSLYIRFGDIPDNEKSKIYRGEQEIGSENGVSVYPAFEDKEGNIILGLNLPITKTSLHTQQHLLEYESRPCYLVTGDYVGKGTDGEPLIKNVRIIKDIKPYRMKQDSALEVWKDMRLEVYQQASGNRHEPNCSDDSTKMFSLNDIDEIIEKISEQSHDNKTKPQLKVGDWIVDDETPNDVFCVIEVLEEIYKVIDIDGVDYHIPRCKVDKQFHSFTIDDAKDGDVLVASDESVFIYAGSTDRYAKFYVGLTKYDTLNFEGGNWDDKNSVHPATKEQRDHLEKAITKAGYEWDADKKELKKESEDEITRNSLIRFLKSPFVHENITDEKVAPWIAWLEKQCEQTK